MSTEKTISKKVDKRTISSETAKIFGIVALILALVGIYTAIATYAGKNSFENLTEEQLKQFKASAEVRENTMDIIGIYYLLSTKQDDQNFQLDQMWRYDDLEKSIRKNLKLIENPRELVDGKPEKSNDECEKNNIKNGNCEELTEIEGRVATIRNVFGEMNQLARDMMLFNMNAEYDKGKKKFEEVKAKVKEFRDQVDGLTNLVNTTLVSETESASQLLNISLIIGLILLPLSLALAAFLIRYLMKFLSISLLPISNLMHNLRQSVFSIDEKGTVVSPVSKYSETIFADDIVGESIDNLVLDHLGKTSEAYSAAKTAITSVFGEDDLQWSLMEDNFPPLVNRIVSNKEKYIKLSYTPLFNKEEIVQNVMVVAEDVTELEKVKQEASKKQAQIKIIQGLIGVDRSDLEAFMADAEAGIKQCFDSLPAMQTDFETRKLIFRTLHTIKGNSRLYNLMALSEVIHVAEQAVVEINSRLDNGEQVGSEHFDSFLSGLRNTEEVLAAHTKVAETLFGIKNTLHQERVELLHELMLACEWAASKEKKVLFDRSQTSEGGVKVQHALSTLDSSWLNNIEKIQRLSDYLESKEIGETTEEILKSGRSESGGWEKDFLNFQNCYFRFFLQSSEKSPFDFTLDELLPFVSAVSSISKITGGKAIGALSQESFDSIIEPLYEAYCTTNEINFTFLRNLVQRAMIGLTYKDNDIFNEALQNMWVYIGWILHIDACYMVEDDEREEFYDELKSVLDEDSEGMDLESGEDSLVSQLYAVEFLGGVPTEEILKNFAKYLAGDDEEQGLKALTGDEKSRAIFEEFLVQAKNGLATEESVKDFDSFVNQINWPEYKELLTSTIHFTALRVDLLRLAGKYVEDEDLAKAAEMAKTYEVSSDWYDDIVALVDQLQYSSKKEREVIREDLQDLLASIFDYPLIALCKKMEPMMRDITMKLGKNINYVVSGEPVALPREQAYALRDALVHMLRNSLDHGIEMPSDRATRGKAEFATIEINFDTQADGTIVISVKDDGNGIDVDRVKAKAVSINAISQETSDSMTIDDAVQLIFLSRLSTKEEVSSLSGRGVGMDAVQSIIINRMKGDINVKTEPKVGTTFTLTVKKSKRSSSSQEVQSEFAMFLSEASKSLAECADLFFDINKEKAAGEKAFRILHTIKGNATMLKQTDIANLIHAAENSVSEIISVVESGQPVDQTSIDQLENEVRAVRMKISTELKRETGGKSVKSELVMFLTDSARSVGECLENIKDLRDDKKVGDGLFRVLHTVKGNAMMLELTEIAEIIHGAENKVSECMTKFDSGQEITDKEFSQLESMVNHVRKVLVDELNNETSDGQGQEEAYTFLADSAKSVAEISDDCSKISTDKEVGNNIFRVLHTLKGNAMLLSLDNVAGVIHTTENFVSEIMQKFDAGTVIEAEDVTKLEKLMEDVRNAIIEEMQAWETDKPTKSKQSPQVVFLQDADKTVKRVGKSLGKNMSDLETARAAFRELHTLKGAASMNNLGQIVDVIHRCENNIEKICNGLENKTDVPTELADEVQGNIVSITDIIASEISKRQKKSGKSDKPRSEADMLFIDFNKWMKQNSNTVKTKVDDKEYIDEMFRELHTTKGKAEMLKLKDLVSQIHTAEEMVTNWADKISKNEAAEDKDGAQGLIEAFSTLAAYCATETSKRNKKAGSKKRSKKSSQPKSESDILMSGFTKWLTKTNSAISNEVYNTEYVDEVFRELHTTKGKAEMLKITSLVEAIHTSEEVVTAWADRLAANKDLKDDDGAEKFKVSLADLQTFCADEVSKKQKRSNVGRRGRKSSEANSEADTLFINITKWLKEIKNTNLDKYYETSFMDEVFRELHTNKSNAEMLSLNDLVKNIHQTEELVTSWSEKISKPDNKPDESGAIEVKQSLEDLYEICSGAAKESIGREKVS